MTGFGEQVLADFLLFIYHAPPEVLIRRHPITSYLTADDGKRYRLIASPRHTPMSIGICASNLGFASSFVYSDSFADLLVSFDSISQLTRLMDAA